ncbi:NitT/TauT family transport system permease protein [Thermocatellispora tengchongensis]|uniref:NitT/TauT family transport system permease protein n=1 Tax=Thermocatellispora tengchongensis TaxID=1073253 RepID=A0A840PAY2_9ACTN|nr:ABC transporter permease [Thermocatellispora tengchongensis]MBB5134560.1 NitT/TauT family transport system permease protein [Thermocatellispora tengchongensis]
MSRERSRKLLPWVSTPLILVVFFALWELFVRVYDVSELVLPGPATVLESLVQVVTDPATWDHARVTATETIAGFLIALVSGVAVGVVLGKVPWLELSLRPMIVASQVVPKVALIPLFVIWFGFGMTSKVIMAAMLAFFPIMLNVQLGVRSVDPGQREVMRSLNSTRWQTFTHLELKSTMPYVFAGMEVGIVLAIIGTIVGEYLGGNEGLGYLVVRTLNELNAPALFATIILLSVLGLLLYFVVNGLKRFFIPWHESVYGQQDANG